MPTISMFNGIKISLNYNDHNPPHIHASYGEEKVTILIHEIEVMSGHMENRCLKMVLGWTALHQNELLQNWELARENKPLNQVKPLI